MNITKKKNNIENTSKELNENKNEINNFFSNNENLCYDFTNYKTSDESPCWHCGHMNKYYKLKCKWCRFPINDSIVPKIIESEFKLNVHIGSAYRSSMYFIT